MKTTELYDAARLARLRKQNRIIGIILAAFCLAAFGVCLFFLFTVNTKNGKANEYAVYMINGFCGCAALIVYMNTVSQHKREIAHGENMLGGEREAVPYDSPLRVSDMIFFVPRSIAVRSVAAKNGESRTLLHVSEQNVRALQSAPERGVLYVVNGYIVAFSDDGGDGE